VAEDVVGGWRLSTVFLGMDHSRHPADHPTLYETMLFDPEGAPVFTRRYRTRTDAEYGHATILAVALDAVAAGGTPLIED
jgi:hypothetical protein